MNTGTTNSDQVETVEERAARYEAEYDARELALMLAQAHALHAADVRENERVAVRNFRLTAIGALVALGALVVTLVGLL